MKKSASIDYTKIQINTQKKAAAVATTATTTTTTTTTTVTKKLMIFKSRQQQTATTVNNDHNDDIEDDDAKKVVTSTATTAKKFCLKRLQKSESVGAVTTTTTTTIKKPLGGGGGEPPVPFIDSDVDDDDVNVFELINTEKARLAKEQKNTQLEVPAVEVKTTTTTTAKKSTKTNGRIIARSGSVKETEKVDKAEPAKEPAKITNGRKNSSYESAANNNGHVNGTKTISTTTTTTAANKKITLKRSSKNASYSDEDEIKSPLEAKKRDVKQTKTDDAGKTKNNGIGHEKMVEKKEETKGTTTKSSKIKLKIEKDDDEDQLDKMDVKTTATTTSPATRRRSSTGSNKSSPTLRKSPSKSKQQQSLNETKTTNEFANETIISGTCGNMQFGLVKESVALISSSATTAGPKTPATAAADSSNSISTSSKASPTLMPNRLGYHHHHHPNGADIDDDDDDDLDDKQNVKRFKLNIKKEVVVAAKSSPPPPPPPPSQSSTTSCAIIKNRIFNTKQSQNQATKTSKITGFKIVFNEDENMDDENEEDEDENKLNKDEKIDYVSTKTASSQKHQNSQQSTNQLSQRVAVKNNNGVYESSSSSSSSASRKPTKAIVEEIHLRNPRRAFECEELGEAQAFLDDLNYLIGGLGSAYRLSERCLSLVKLAEQCLSSEFRMSLRSSLLPPTLNTQDDTSTNTGVYYLNKLFDLLSDATKYKSLSLCTCLIIYELTQDKLSVEIDQSLFNLILEIVNEFTSSSSADSSSSSSSLSDDEFAVSHLNDLPWSGGSTKASRSSSGCSSMTSSPSNPQQHHHHQHQQQHKHAHLGDLDVDETDDLVVYKKVSAKCRKLFEKISPLFASASASVTYSNQSAPSPSSASATACTAHNQVEVSFSTSLLSLDCLLNLNKNTRNLLYLNETYKAQLRETRVIEKLIARVRFISELMQSNPNLVDPLIYGIDRYIQCLSLLQTITQAPQQSSASIGQQPKKKLLSICYDSAPTPEFVLNQNYLIEYREGFFVDLLKKTLETCCEQLIISQKKSARSNRANPTPSPAPSDDQPSKSNLYAMLTNLVKDIYLLLINITHNNEASCEKLASDKELLDVSLKLILLDSTDETTSATCHIAEEMKFDIQIMILGFLINLFVNSLKKKSVVNLVNYKNKKLNMNLLDVILKIYLAKEALVQLAEDDHQNELEKINEQIESQNMENINAAIMNSIHKAGKHMEDHIIAAHAALIIGYLLINDRYFNQDQRRFKIDTIRDKIKDHSFQVMAQIIRKFVVFMNIMKVGGFSADEHIEIILKHLDEFDIE